MPKKDAELNLIKNLWPLTLLNCDYKVATKAIASRIKTVIPKLIYDDHTGFITGRFIRENREKNIPGLLLFLDFEKAFDTLERSFIQKTFLHFGFRQILTELDKSILL